MQNTIYRSRGKLLLLSLSLALLPSILSNSSTVSAESLKNQKGRHAEIDVETLVEVALQTNPGIQATLSQIEALQEKIPQAGAWEDSKLSLSYQNVPVDSFSLGETPMSGIEIILSQKFPLWGKIKLREEIAEANVQEKSWELQENKNALASLIKKNFYSLTLSRQLKTITKKHISLLDKFIDSVRYKYETGSVGQHELLRLQLRHSKLSDDLQDFSQTEDTITARLKSALHRDSNTSIPTPKFLSASTVQYSVDELMNMASEKRPLLAKLKEQNASQILISKLSTRQALPDITAWAKYRYREAIDGGDDGTDFAGVGLSVPVPLFYKSKYRAKANEFQARAASTRQKRSAAIDTLRAEVVAETSRLERALSKSETYQNILLPKAKAALDATFSAYQVGRAEFASFFEAELQVLRFEIELRKTQATALIAKTELERLVGTSSL